MFGSSGGAGRDGEINNNDDYDGGHGGDGGGIVYVAADSVTVSGTVSSDGDAGTNGDNLGYNGGGGGGAGGSVKILGNTLALGSSVVTATGGNSTQSSEAGGGDGGVGRIAVYYGSEVSGTTYPNAEAAEVPQHPYSVFISDVITILNGRGEGIDFKWNPSHQTE